MECMHVDGLQILCCLPNMSPGAFRSSTPNNSPCPPRLQSDCSPMRCEGQPVPDFHGLRDFYALAKALAKAWPNDWNARTGGRDLLRWKRHMRNFHEFPGCPIDSMTPYEPLKTVEGCIHVDQWNNPSSASDVSVDV